MHKYCILYEGGIGRVHGGRSSVRRFFFAPVATRTIRAKMATVPIWDVLARPMHLPFLPNRYRLFFGCFPYPDEVATIMIPYPDASALCLTNSENIHPFPCHRCICLNMHLTLLICSSKQLPN